MFICFNLSHYQGKVYTIDNYFHQSRIAVTIGSRVRGARYFMWVNYLANSSSDCIAPICTTIPNRLFKVGIVILIADKKISGRSIG